MKIQWLIGCLMMALLGTGCKTTSRALATMDALDPFELSSEAVGQLSGETREHPYRMYDPLFPVADEVVSVLDPLAKVDPFVVADDIDNEYTQSKYNLGFELQYAPVPQEW